MERAKVYFADLRASERENLLAKIVRLLDSAGLQSIVLPRSLVAVKLHFGEKGNTAFIRPNFIRAIVDRVRSLGGHPFLTDSNTLYVGARADSVAHLTTAIENGFAYAVVNAPLIIADGLRGGSYKPVTIDGEVIKVAYVAGEIAETDVLLSVAHFKGHGLSGFGGTLKNLGMGCASRRGKLVQHSDVSPKIQRKKCIACGNCVEHCSQGAITVHDKKAVIDQKKCIGCGECILICSNKAIDVNWNADAVLFQKKITEYACAALKNKQGRVLFLSFLTDISPACDCYGHNDAPIVPDIGILASTDPVAIDQASVDLVNRQAGLENSSLTENRASGEDKFGAVYPRVDWRVQIEHAAKLGMGTREYDLIRI
ncbi:MAG: DUF362 domain-containing protein [Desulfobacteraceae bacterium]|nr:MAG: DUF362 domain-containing protein [Desulfobacteraceae bacterium]